MHLNSFQYYKPAEPAELIELLTLFGSQAMMLSGGTDVLVMMKDKMIRPEVLIDVTGLKELFVFEDEPGRGLTIGAGVKIEAIEKSGVVRGKYQALAQAAAALGSPQVRAMASIGGNACTASPAADTPPALIALEAEATIAGPDGTRTIPYEDFITGYRTTALRPSEYLQKIFVPEPESNTFSRFDHLGLRDAVECDLVNLAASVRMDGAKISKSRVVIGAAAEKAVRSLAAEQVLADKSLDADVIEQAGRAAAQDAMPIDDIRATAAYRKAMIPVLAARIFNAIRSDAA
jgi:carbon-monoxide dehydrogenase medium subunit